MTDLVKRVLLLACAMIAVGWSVHASREVDRLQNQIAQERDDNSIERDDAAARIAALQSRTDCQGIKR